MYFWHAYAKSPVESPDGFCISPSLLEVAMEIEGPRDIGGNTEPWFYELVPLFELPEVDLTKSVKGQLLRWRLVIGIINLIAKLPFFFFFTYVAFLAVGMAAFFVVAPTGRVLAIIALFLGLPSLILTFSMLRFDLLVVMVKTYDVWFFGVTSTLVAIAASLLVHDTRALVLFVSWVSFFVSIFVDANLYAIRNIWITGAISTACYVVLAGLVSLEYADGLEHVYILNTNGHRLPASAIVRDGLLTMVVLILRNLFRRYHHAIKKQQITVGTSVLVVRCVTFRCRLQLRELPMDSNAVIARKSVRREALPGPADSVLLPSATRLRFAPFLGPLDVRNSLIPVPWFWSLDPEISSWWTRGGQRGIRVIGAMCFMISNVIIIVSLISPASTDRTGMVIAAIGTASLSLIMVSLCLMTAHRQLLYALMTSFDFLYIACQGVVIHVTLADLVGWRPDVTAALACDLIWSTWMMCWDAVPPPARKRLGLTSIFAAYIGTGLIVTINITVLIVVFVLPPGAINDRPILQFNAFGNSFGFSVLTWYLSCASTIVSWAIRIIWRLWRASPRELVVLDGPVFFEKPLRSREARQRPPTRAPTLKYLSWSPHSINPVR